MELYLTMDIKEFCKILFLWNTYDVQQMLRNTYESYCSFENGVYILHVVSYKWIDFVMVFLGKQTSPFVGYERDKNDGATDT